VKQDENDKKLKLFSKDEPAAQDVEEVSSGDSTPEESNPSTDAGEVSGSLDRNVGRTFGGRYKVESKIGRGGMGHVYLAEQIGLGRKVVVKLLAHDPQADSGNSAERFVREAQTLSKLNHPNIVGVHDFGRDSEESYIIMEYVDGYRLDTLIKRSGHIELDTFIVIARQMLDAVGEAHEQGIIHRDLKPSNIMLTTRKGMPYYVKVLDFGLAKLLEDDSELTGKHSLVGSLSYLAPEQILGEPTDQRVDVYALGVLFYYMLAGRKPFLGRDTRVLYQHIHEDAEPLGDVLPAGHGVPNELINLIHLCLAKDSAHRPADANELLIMLLEIFDPSFLNSMQNPAEFSGQSFSGIHRVALREQSEASNDSRNIIRAAHSTGQVAGPLEGSSPSFSSPSFSSPSLSSPSNRALVIEDDSIDEDSLPLLEVNVAEERSNGSVAKIAIGAILFVVLGAAGAVAISSMNNGATPENVAGEANNKLADATDANSTSEAKPATETAAVAKEEPAETAPAAVEVAKYKIATSPVSATVTLDGKEIGSTPVDLELEPGSHKIILSADGYDELEREITAQAGQDKELALAMIAAPAAKDPAPRRRPVKKRPVAKKTEKDSPAKKEVASKTEEEKPKAVEKKPEAVKSYDDGVQLLDDGSKSKKKKGGEYELLDIQ
jgi:serine/threonine protein kinase